MLNNVAETPKKVGEIGVLETKNDSGPLVKIHP